MFGPSKGRFLGSVPTTVLLPEKLALLAGAVQVAPARELPSARRGCSFKVISSSLFAGASIYSARIE